MRDILVTAKVLTKHAFATDRTDDKRRVVMDAMFRLGALRGLLSDPEWVRVGSQADGYGADLAGLWADQDYDWSHVRDSSDRGIQAMFRELCAVVDEKIAAQK